MATSLVTVDKLVFWLNNEWNVLLRGKHGVGKTSMILEAFKEAGLKNDEWLYFSGSTLDPWVDFVGVPKEKIDPSTGESFLELVRPKAMASDKVRVIFIDEYNRSHKKIRNAAMELIQFKSINGKKFPNLKAIWVAVNPDNEEDAEYDVETIDPAQLDRFQIQVDIEYKPHRGFFVSKYGADMASAAIGWWNSLPKDMQNGVSPRRLEYSLDVFKKNGDLHDVLPEKANIKRLLDQLRSTPALTTLRQFFEKEDKTSAKKWLADENNYEYVINEITKQPNYTKFFVPLLPEEKISMLIVKERGVRSYALRSYKEEKVIQDVLSEIKTAGTNQSVCKEIERAFQKDRQSTSATLDDKPTVNPNKVESYVAKDANGSPLDSNPDWNAALDEASQAGDENTVERFKIIKIFETKMPKNMSEQEALKGLNIVQSIIERSHERTLSRWGDIVAITNNLIENLEKKGYDFSKFGEQYGKILDYCMPKKGFYFGQE
jgi:hypothetical protein